MKKYFKAKDVDTLYTQLIEAISTEPEYTASPRGMSIKESTGVVAVLEDPRQSVVKLVDRKLNYAFGVIEKLEYLSGQTDPDRLVFYNSNFENYRSEYGIFDGAYPERLGYWYRHIYNLLKADPDTRQAVMTIYGVQDRHKSKDIPCTLSFQFIIREGKLKMIAHMRSNDLLWGFPYDTAGFCFIQEALAACLGVELGTYELHAGSLHIYTEREKQLTKLLNNDAKHSFELPTIPKYESIDALYDDLRGFWIAERSLRVNSKRHAIVSLLPRWLQEYYAIVEEYVTRKNNTPLPIKAE